MVEVICDTSFLIHLSTKKIKNLSNIETEIGSINFVVPQKNSIKYVDVLITNSKQLPEGSHFKFRDFKGKAVLLVNRKGEIRAFSSVCPHLGCDVKWESDRDRFLCPCHIGIFDPNGSVVSGPPSKKLTEFAVKVENGNIYVSLVEA